MANPTDHGQDFEFISMHVRNPRTHLVHGWPVFTDYEIAVETNSMIFAKQNTQVRRRFSEFVWLWRHLSRYSSLGLKLPSLPTKRRVFGRFSKEFLEERRSCVQEALAGLTRITPVLADSAFHLFLQSSLSVKEMEGYICGTDKRDLLEIIDPEGVAEYREHKDTRCTCHSTGDSGFSGSLRPEDVEQTRRVLDDVSNWVASQQNYISVGLMGNGWSSGYTCQSLRKSRSSSQLRCPGCSDKQSNRRLSLTHNVASVLPGGQLKIAPTGINTPRDNETNGESSGGVSGDSKPYDGDDETELDLSDYDIVTKEPFIRVRDWLNSQNEKFHADAECDSSDEEEGTVDASPKLKDVRVKEYDVISVPCSGKPSNCQSTASVGYHSNEEGGSVLEGEAADDEEGDNDSEFTVLHSSIGGLDWKDRDELSSSCDSLHSAALFLTYDVVEMIELRYNNVV